MIKETTFKRELRPLAALVDAEETGRRTKGYLARCLELSEQQMVDGVEHRVFTEQNWLLIGSEYPRARHRFGLGDAVGMVATPIARAFGADCVDKETKQLKPDSDCAGRKAAMNKLSDKVVDAVTGIFKDT